MGRETMSLIEMDLLSMDNCDLDFTNWVISRANQDASIESQLVHLQGILGENVFTELQDQKVIVYYSPDITFEIVLDDFKGKNMVYLVGAEKKELVYSVTPFGFPYQQLVSCWMDFQRNRLEKIVKSKITINI